MKKLSLYLILTFCIITMGLQAGVIVPELDDSSAIGNFTIARNGALNDVPDITTGEMTLAARFNPAVNQATGRPIIVIENGGTSNGTGLYLANGHLIFVTKGANGRYSIPTSLNDTDFTNDGTGKAMAVDLGPINFGVENKVYVSMDLNNGELFASINGYPRMYTITGAIGTENLDGNLSVSFLGVAPIPSGEYGWLGGLLEAGETTYPFLFWTNALPMVQTAGYTNQRGQVFNTAVTPLSLPHDPTPANGAINVDPDVVTALSFYTGDDPDNPGSPNPAITGHWVTIFTVQNGEPNYLEPPLEVSPLIPAGTDPITYPFTFSEDQVVYWQVEEQIDGLGKGDPNNIIGVVWSFEAVPSAPAITGSPSDVLRFPATDPDYEGAAVLTCQFTSKSELTAVEWYRGDNPNTPISDADADITISLDQNGSSYTSTLTIDNIELADEDSYWCYVQNTAGEDTSDTADLGVKRQVAHWTLDEADLVDGRYMDISGEGHHADPNIVPGSASFIDGVDPAETGDGLDFAVEPLVAADSNDWAPSLYTGQVTISAWLNWAGPDGGWQGVVSNRSAVGATTANFYIEIRQDNGNLQIGGIPGAGDVQVAPLPIGEWAHLAITARAGEVVIYINGDALNTNTAAQAVLQNIVPVRIGALNRSAEGELLSTYNGVMDDVQLYNYALSGTEVVDLYYDVLETPTCLNPLGLDLGFDVAGGGISGDEPDCKIGLPDFAAFAATWLNCGLYPVCP